MMLYIFEVTMKRGIDPNDYVKAWKRGSEIIQKSPGSLGIRLYRKVGHQGKLLNVAAWESKTSRDIAMETLKHRDSVTRSMLHKHEDFGTVNVIGEFEETSWVVDIPSAEKD